MARYRKKPVTIEAVQWWPDQPESAPVWYLDAMNMGTINVRSPIIEIRTLEGTMTAQPGDWIICGVKGEIYPCKPDIFDATYEVAESEKEAA
jgi:hypothetical protein